MDLKNLFRALNHHFVPWALEPSHLIAGVDLLVARNTTSLRQIAWSVQLGRSVKME